MSDADAKKALLEELAPSRIVLPLGAARVLCRRRLAAGEGEEDRAERARSRYRARRLADETMERRPAPGDGACAPCSSRVSRGQHPP